MADGETTQQQKRASLDDLSKEDLIKKYKSALTIAQKAKAAKDELAEELNQVKSELQYQHDENEKEKRQCKEEEKKLSNKVATLQEIVSSLTDQKLEFTMQIDQLQRSNSETQKLYHSACDTIDGLRKESAKLSSQYEDATTLSEGLKRQVKRLTEENDDLLSQLDILSQEVLELKTSKPETKSEETSSEEKEEEDVQSLKLISKAKDDKLMAMDKKINELQLVIQALNEEKTIRDADFKKVKEEMFANLREINVKHQTEVELKEMEKQNVIELTHTLESLREEIKTKDEHFKDEKQAMVHKIEELQSQVSNCESHMQALQSDREALEKKEGELMNELKRMDTQKCELENLLKKKKENIQKLKTEVATLEESVKTKESEVNDLVKTGNRDRSKLEENLSLIASKSSELDELKDKLKVLKEENENDSKFKESLQKELDTYKEKLEIAQRSSDTDLDQLKMSLSQSLADKVKLEEELSKTIDDKVKLEDNVRDLQIQLKDISADKNSLEEKLQHLKANEDVTVGEIDKLKEQFNLLKQENEAANDIRESLMKELSEYKENLENAQCSSNASLSELEKSLSESMAEKVKFEEELSKAVDDKVRFEDKIKDLQANYQTILAEKNSLVEELQISNADKKHNDAELVKLQEQLNLLKQDNETVKDFNESLQKELSTYKEKLENVQSSSNASLSELEKSLSESAAVKVKIEEELSKTVDEKVQFENDVRDLKGKVQELSAEKSSVRDEMQRLENEKEQYVKDLARLQGIIDAMTEAKDKREKDFESIIDDKNAAKESKVVELQKEMLNKDKEHQKTCKLLRNENDKLRAEIAAHKKEISALKADVVRLQESVSNVELLNSEMRYIVDKLKEENEKLEKEKGNSKQLIEGLESKCAVLNEELSDLSSKLEEKECVVSKTEESVETLNKKLEVLSLEKLEWRNKEKELLSKATDAGDLSEKVEQYLATISDQQLKIIDLEKVNKRMSDELGRLEKASDDVERNEKERMIIMSKSDELKKRVQEFEEQLSESRSFCNKQHLEIEGYQRELENLKLREQQLLSDLNNVKSTVSKLGQTQAKKIKGLRNEVTTFRSCIADSLGNTFAKELKTQSEAILGRIQEDLEARLSSADKRNRELLKEMNEMNQVIKQRGEKLSQLSCSKLDLEKNVKSLEAKVTELERTLETRQTELTGKEEELQLVQTKLISLETNDIANCEQREKELKEKIQIVETERNELKRQVMELEREKDQSKDPGESEVMSTSTLSRADESGRLRELEDTFEDRYTKLRLVAVKLKKKASEQAAQLTQLTAERGELQSRISQLVKEKEVFANHAKNSQGLVLAIDKLQDDLETCEKDKKGLQKDLEAAVKDAANAKIQLQEEKESKDTWQKQCENLKREKKSMETSVKELRSQQQTTQKEMESEAIRRKDKEKEVVQLEEEIKNVKQKLSEELNKIKGLSDQLDQAKQETKKKSLLSLEMADYERTVSELTKQLEEMKADVTEKEKALDDERNETSSLHERVIHLEKQSTADTMRAEQLEVQLSLSKNQIKDLESASVDRERELFDTRHRAEGLQSQVEELELQLATLASERQRDADAARRHQESLAKQISLLESQLASSSELLSGKEAELKGLKEDYEGYKVRAQSVLRQQRSQQTVGNDSNLLHQEQQATLERTVEMLQRRVDDLNSRLQESGVELSVACKERDLLQERLHEACNRETEIHVAAAKRLEEEKREGERQSRIRADTLARTHRAQIQELEERHAEEIALLKERLRKADSVARLESPPKTESPPAKEHGTNFVSEKQPPSFSDGSVCLMEREEGEGSESVESMSPLLVTRKERSKEPVPLEELLSSPSGDGPVADNSDSRENLLQRLKSLERKISHLTALLSEAEANSARFSQLCDALKEEIRRQERSEERQRHGHNLEYLKNVVVKFITLQGGDERARLVPVLNTLLKLSPDELSQMQAAAVGSDVSGASQSWGSYLHLWSNVQ